MMVQLRWDCQVQRCPEGQPPSRARTMAGESSKRETDDVWKQNYGRAVVGAPLVMLPRFFATHLLSLRNTRPDGLPQVQLPSVINRAGVRRSLTYSRAPQRRVVGAFLGPTSSSAR